MSVKRMMEAEAEMERLFKEHDVHPDVIKVVDNVEKTQICVDN